ncbi:NAD(P)-binding protein [Lentinus tigrinus ALCF2SS1-6]|uniref:NAD(P)-binding protein n=1 Tax=Lentinus tigrinus ALCF2SS1-6 TaxID=1328759 RepID=A0A5C2RZY4_9APHY|nr:NAD(P)-binding protein [Lentinus tigrinus ALCF2SS1-6]
MGGTFSKDSGPWPVIVQMFPPKPKFSVDQISDLTGRVALVTGGNVGIGYETTKALLQHNAKVYLASRSKEKADAAIASLKEATGKEPIFLELDLAHLASVKKAAEEFLSKEHELHILFNNALTKDGYDLTFGTNCIGPWYFTELLMPALLEGVKTSPDHHARIVTTSSSAAYFKGGILNYELFKDGPARRKATSTVMYYQSKFVCLRGNVVVARQVAKRYAEKGIASVEYGIEAFDAGNIQSSFQRDVPNFIRVFGVTIIEPGSFHTEGQAKTIWVPVHPAYSNPELPASRLRNGWGAYSGTGDVKKAVEAIYKIAFLPEPPLHFLLGEDAIMYARKQWADVAADTDKYESWSKGLEKDS